VGGLNMKSSSYLVNNRRFLVREKSVAYLGSKCSLCNYSKCLDALEFHHKNPKEKDFQISGNHCRKWETIQKELDKCVLLCSNCHQETHIQLVKQKKLERKLESSKKILVDSEILCDCGRIYSFSRNKGNSKTKCNSCRTAKRRETLKQQFCKLKGNECEQCGYSAYPETLIFHHKDPSKKDFSIASGYTKSLYTVLKELDKCSLLCHNCHREEHFKLRTL